jgi:hypothetical protein
MAVWSLISMTGELMEGEDPWFSAFMVMLWVYFAWRSSRSGEEASDGQD